MHRDEIPALSPPATAPAGAAEAGDIELVLDAGDPGDVPRDLVIDLYADVQADSVLVVDTQAEVERARQAVRLHLERRRVAAVSARADAAPPDTATPSALGGTRLNEARFCVIDLETTGLRPGHGDEILEIGALHLADGELGREFSTLVNPLRPISAAAVAIHGIHDREVAAAPLIAEVLPYLEEMARDRVLVFHNAPFDLGFIQRALSEHGREPLAGPVLDTLVLARRLLAGRCGLGQVAERLGVDSPHAHRALADARLTALVLRRLLALLAEEGAGSLADVPGWVAAPVRPRRRPTPRPDLLARRLRRAIDDGEILRLAYRLAPALAPFELRVRPLRLVGGLHLLACDLDRGEEILLEVARLDRLTRVP